jgi:hypothetical protein
MVSGAPTQEPFLPTSETKQNKTTEEKRTCQDPQEL